VRLQVGWVTDRPTTPDRAHCMKPVLSRCLVLICPLTGVQLFYPCEVWGLGVA
jgi:hypothetical protein